MIIFYDTTYSNLKKKKLLDIAILTKLQHLNNMSNIGKSEHMVRGIATDGKKYKHLKRNDEKWLCKDLNDIKKTVENYIDNIRPDEKKTNETVKKAKKKTMTIDRIFAIIVLAIFGSISLITGIYLILKENYLIGISLTIFGSIFVITFILYEKYR